MLVVSAMARDMGLFMMIGAQNHIGCCAFHWNGGKFFATVHIYLRLTTVRIYGRFDYLPQSGRVNRRLHIGIQRPVLCQLSVCRRVYLGLLLTTSITCANKLQQTFAENSPLPRPKQEPATCGLNALLCFCINVVGHLPPCTLTLTVTGDTCTHATPTHSHTHVPIQISLHTGMCLRVLVLEFQCKCPCHIWEIYL